MTDTPAANQEDASLLSESTEKERANRSEMLSKMDQEKRDEK